MDFSPTATLTELIDALPPVFFEYFAFDDAA
jgi:hypothetical protein